MTSREFQDVIEMTKTQHWRVFESFVTQKHNEFVEAVLMPIDKPDDVFASERSKGAEMVLRELVKEFRSHLVEQLKHQQEIEDNGNSV